MVIILMGVSGAGKTTVGTLLAKKLGWQFFDGDDFHDASSRKKMAAGSGLTDDDREDWLARLRDLVGRMCVEKKHAVLACSALKRSYRKRLQADPECVFFVFLKGSHEQIKKRLTGRQHHFAAASLMESQFAALEEPTGALEVDTRSTPAEIVAYIIEKLPLTPGDG